MQLEEEVTFNNRYEASLWANVRMYRLMKRDCALEVSVARTKACVSSGRQPNKGISQTGARPVFS